ncbi:MAG: hypothetical protein RR139_12645, partial [Lachnospiraceae bacterium]
YLTKIKISHVNYVPYLHNDATVADGFNKDMKVYCVQAPPLEKLFPQTFSERIDMTLFAGFQPYICEADHTEVSGYSK